MGNKISLNDALMNKAEKVERVPGFKDNRWLKPADFEKDGVLECMFVKQYEDKNYGGIRFEVSDKSGEEKHLPNVGSLRYQLEKGVESGLVSPGTKLEIAYDGMEFVKKYNREIHKFSVDLLED